MTHGSAWSDNEVTTLIAIWGDEDIQEQLDGATRNKTIFETISKKLQESGYNRDWQQCRAKIKNLKAEYKKIKDHNGVTGNGRKTFKFYKLDEILGHRPASAPTFVVDTSSPSHGTATAQSQESDAEGEADDTGNVQVLSSVDSALVPADVTFAELGEPKDKDHATSSTQKKKCKLEKEKKSKGERAMERAIESFVKYQSEAEEKFRKREEEHWEKEMEREEKRHREDREHEMRLFQMLGQMTKPWESHYTTNYPPSPYSEY